jgi:hypothetical protein
LLVDFADLATLTDPACLLTLFSKPVGPNFNRYSMEVRFAQQSLHSDRLIQGCDFLKEAVLRLYQNPQSSVMLPRRPDLDIEAITMSIWAQQWPRLRRSFRFCTFSITDRATQIAPFDLQITREKARSARSGPLDQGVDAAANRSSVWLEDAITDLVNPNVKGLRTFLRQVGGDIELGREAFPVLVELHVITGELATEPPAMNRAIAMLQNSFSPGEAQALKNVVIGAAIRHLDELGTEELDFVLSNLQLVQEGRTAAEVAHLARVICKRDPDRFIRMLSGTETGQSIAANALATMSQEELLNVMVASPALASPILSQRKDLLNDASVWNAAIDSSLLFDSAVGVLKQSPTAQSPEIMGMLTAQRPDLARRIANELDPTLVLDALETYASANAGDATKLDPWIDVVATRPSAIAQFLAANRRRTHASFLDALARRISPDAVPNEYGTDPWLIALRSMEQWPEGSLPLYLCAFLLSRSLGNTTRNSAELAQITFEPIYVAASIDVLPIDAWRVLENRVPTPFLWFYWDRCEALRLAVVDLFSDRDLSPTCFAYIAKDDEIFATTARTAARTNRGRRFLKQVRQALKAERQVQQSGRIRVLEELID